MQIPSTVMSRPKAMRLLALCSIFSGLKRAAEPEKPVSPLYIDEEADEPREAAVLLFLMLLPEIRFASAKIRIF